MEKEKVMDWEAEYIGWQKSELSQRTYSEKCGYSVSAFKNGMTRTGCRKRLKKRRETTKSRFVALKTTQTAAIENEKLTGAQFMALCSMAISKNLTKRDVAYVLRTAIRDGELDTDQCAALCYMAISEKLTGSDLTNVLKAAIESEKLTGAQFMALCSMAISENLTGRDLDYVFNTAIRSGKLTDPQRGLLNTMASAHSNGFPPARE